MYEKGVTKSMNATQLMLAMLQDNDDNDLLFSTWWKQSFSFGLTRTSTAQMFPDDDGNDDNDNDDDDAMYVEKEM